MKIELIIERDDELNKEIKTLCEGYFKGMVRGEIEKTIKDTLQLKIESTRLDRAIDNHAHEIVKDYFNGWNFRETVKKHIEEYIEEYIKQQAEHYKEIVDEKIQNIKVQDILLNLYKLNK